MPKKGTSVLLSALNSVWRCSGGIGNLFPMLNANFCRPFHVLAMGQAGTMFDLAWVLYEGYCCISLDKNCIEISSSKILISARQRQIIYRNERTVVVAVLNYYVLYVD